MSDNNTNDILVPEELDLDSEKVQQLNDNRYVISSNETTGPSSTTIDKNNTITNNKNSYYCRNLMDLEGEYALELHAKFEQESDSLCVETNDVSEAFESMLRWYAEKVADDTPPEKVIRVLISRSNLKI